MNTEDRVTQAERDLGRPLTGGELRALLTDNGPGETAPEKDGLDLDALLDAHGLVQKHLSDEPPGDSNVMQAADNLLDWIPALTEAHTRLRSELAALRESRDKAETMLVVARGVANDCLGYADTAFCGQAPLGVKHTANRILKYLDMDGPPDAWHCFFKGCDRVGIHVLACPLSTLKARESRALNDGEHGDG